MYSERPKSKQVQFSDVRLLSHFQTVRFQTKSEHQKARSFLHKLFYDPVIPKRPSFFDQKKKFRIQTQIYNWNLKFWDIKVSQF